MRVRPLAVAAIAVAGQLSTLPPAHAEVGAVCGMLTVGDATQQSGVLGAGPMVSVTSTGGVAPATVNCTVQLNSEVHGAGPVVAAGSGSPAFLAAVSFTAAPTDNVYVCTELVLLSGPVNWDADSSTPGDQCALVLTQDVGGVRVMATWGYDICVFDRNENEIVCVPW